MLLATPTFSGSLDDDVVDDDDDGYDDDDDDDNAQERRCRGPFSSLKRRQKQTQKNLWFRITNWLFMALSLVREGGKSREGETKI